MGKTREADHSGKNNKKMDKNPPGNTRVVDLYSRA